MSPEDREQIVVLRQQQLELQRSLARLDIQLSELEIRVASEQPETPPPLPPLPLHVEPAPLPEPTNIIPHVFPPLPAEPAPVARDLPTIPPPTPIQPVTPPPPFVPAPPAPSFEFQFGRFMVGVGALFGVILLALIFGLAHHYIFKLLGPAGILGISALASIGVGIAGQRVERRGESIGLFGQMLTAMALAWLYLTAYAACYYPPLQIITSPWIAGLLLLSWSIYVFLLAERKKSQTLSVFAITLAYISTAINPIDHFTMAADLLLAGTATLFMIRNGWAALTYFSLFGTYWALLRRLTLDDDWNLVLDTSRLLHFWPHAIYLSGAWIIFTAGVIFTKSPTFRGGKRLAFLSLNNGALGGLMLLITYLAGYGHGPMGWSLLGTGIVLLFTSRIVGWAEIEPGEAMAAYAAQGLALFTAGIMVVFTGVTRGFLLMLETLYFGAAAVFSGDRILTITTYVSGFFATMFLIWEIAVESHHPWLLGFGGAFVLLLNAWWARNDMRHSPKARTTIVLPTSYFCVLALGLIYTALSTELSENDLPPALAVASLALTFTIYFVSIYELPPLAQILLVIAQYLVLFPTETGEEMPWWTTAWVAVITLVMLTWWSRQRITRSGSWVGLLNFVYALALACLAYETIRPWVNVQDWMICSSLLAVAFLVWGGLTRVWAVAAVGQIFLAISVYHYFLPPGGANTFPYAWWAAAMPMVIVFSTARATHTWLRLFPEIPFEWSTTLRALAYSYQLLVLIMLIRFVHALVPDPDQIAAFLFLGTFLLSWNVYHPSAFGVRASYILSLCGVGLYLSGIVGDARAHATFLNGLAFLCFLAQPLLLRPSSKTVHPPETWALMLVSVFSGWLFVSEWVLSRFNPGYLTMNWALYALFLFFIGQITSEKRLTWCGYGILIAAIIRVALVDFWGLSSGYKILTFLVLTIIAFAVGYVSLRTEDRARKNTPPSTP